MGCGQYMSTDMTQESHHFHACFQLCAMGHCNNKGGMIKYGGKKEYLKYIEIKKTPRMSCCHFFFFPIPLFSVLKIF